MGLHHCQLSYHTRYTVSTQSYRMFSVCRVVGIRLRYAEPKGRAPLRRPQCRDSSRRTRWWQISSPLDGGGYILHGWHLAPAHPSVASPEPPRSTSDPRSEVLRGGSGEVTAKLRRDFHESPRLPQPVWLVQNMMECPNVGHLFPAECGAFSPLLLTQEGGGLERGGAVC